MNVGHLLIGVLSLATGIGLFALGLPNRANESPRFLRFYSAPMLYPPIVLVFLAIGIAELIAWAAMMK